METVTACGTWSMRLTLRAPSMSRWKLRYQPIGFRWAQNLSDYRAPEPERFVAYYDSMAASSSVVLMRAVALVP